MIIFYLKNNTNFMNTHIAKIFDVEDKKFIYVKFLFTDEDTDKILNEFDYIHFFNINNVEFFSKNKDEVKAYMSAKQYNL